jgi:hypothetical protein
MQDNKHIDDFEKYLREEVSEHRMYPSDRVWKNIRAQIQTPKKWPALSVFTVMIISALVIGTILNKPMPDSVTPNFVYSLQSPITNTHPAKTPEQIKNNEQIAESNYSIAQLTTRTITAAVEKIKITEFETTAQQHLNISSETENSKTSSVQNTVATAGMPSAKTSSKDITSTPLLQPSNISFSSFRNINNYLFDITSRLKTILNSGTPSSKGGVAFFTDRRNDIAYYDINFQAPVQHNDLLPSLNQLGKTSSRFDFRFYLTPSISYRRLDEKSQDTKASTGASLESDYRIKPSNAINQSPSVGYETGAGLGYKLSNKLKLTGGFQFNISQYEINAYLHKDEPIAVAFGDGDNLNTVSTVSNLRTASGNTPLAIKNRYYQLSLPVGIEWQILGGGKLSWGVGASIQPTYTFDKQPLIISSNFKNYADGSAYVRNWNVNANATTYLGYTTGKYQWQIGPQLRYQLLPSLVNKYPNKEYLVNYGLRIGMVKQLK